MSPSRRGHPRTPEPRITHPEKVLFPRDGYTKHDVVMYYVTIAPAMLPLMEKHPIAMLRFNDGLDGERFYHKRTPKYFPDYIDRVTLEFSDGKTQYSVINNVEALAYVANHNSIELHILPASSDDIFHPDRLVFDFDPSVDDFDSVRQAARWARELFENDGLVCFPMVSGSRGIHLWMPLDGSADTEQAHTYADTAARRLAEAHPDELTTEFTKADRGDRIYLDTARNAPGQHAVAPYSLRARDGAPVAMPISWDELDDVVPQQWNIRTAADRLDADPWQDLAQQARPLPAG